MTKILDTLRTPGAMLVALVLALVAQLEHTAQVFMQVIGANGVYAQVHAYAFACAVEVAVLLFVLAGHKRISYGFALATFATNLSYYAMHDVALLSIAGAPAWLMSALLPCAVVGYSHTIAETPPAAPDAPRSSTATSDIEAPVALPDAISGHCDANTPAADTAPETASTDVPAALTPAQRRAHIAEQEMYNAAQVAAQFGISLRAAQLDIAQVRKAMTQTNGVQP